jgi:molecular chaperone HtpG
MTATEHGFKAEVQQLLDLMIHSVYSDREVFVRELVSNAADALDKVKFLALTRKDLVPAASEKQGIRITVDAAARIVIFEDDGIGMTGEEVVDHLGTIAKSGSKEFLAKLKDAGQDAPKLIGQFGVGFYSCFMVAEEVEVITRSAIPGGSAVRWHSKGAGAYTVEDADRATRGTTITLTLREDAAEYADETLLKEIVRKHSNFLPWPIDVQGEQANSGKALWAEPPNQVTDVEAAAFYRQIAGDWRDPALRVHLSVDSPFQYHALLFVPEERPHDLWNPRAERGPRLYAKRVLILEHAQELLPEWLRFVKGVVDSEDIQLNVSREMVQKTPLVRKMRDALTKRILKDLLKLAENTEEKQQKTWRSIWREFGSLLKEGYYAGNEYREQLLPLLRFNATSHDDADGLVSLADYKAGMKPGQDTIWYVAAETRGAALASPHLEAFKQRGWDVLVLTDPVDEWLIGVLDAYEGLPLKSVSRGELNLDEPEAGDRADLSGLIPFIQTTLDGQVKSVRSSSRLTDSAAVLVDDDTGISSNMERLLRQANQAVPGARRILELNPRHPLIRSLNELHARGKTGDVEPLARLLLDDALLLEGSVKDPAAMGKRLQAMLEKAAQSALAEAKPVEPPPP